MVPATARDGEILVGLSIQLKDRGKPRRANSFGVTLPDGGNSDKFGNQSKYPSDRNDRLGSMMEGALSLPCEIPEEGWISAWECQQIQSERLQVYIVSPLSSGS